MQFSLGGSAKNPLKGKTQKEQKSSQSACILSKKEGLLSTFLRMLKNINLNDLETLPKISK